MIHSTNCVCPLALLQSCTVNQFSDLIKYISISTVAYAVKCMCAVKKNEHLRQPAALLVHSAPFFGTVFSQCRMD